MPPTHPKLRWPLDLRLEKIEAQELLIINCPLGVSKEPLILDAVLAPIIACFEGNLSKENILSKFSGQGLTIELLEQVINLLDERLFLATAKFFAAQKSMLEDFTNSLSRKAALAGISYSSNAKELEKEIDGYLKHGADVNNIQDKKLCTLVSPHIDYKRGAITYGKTYAYLKESRADLFILIGTLHQYSKYLFQLCNKDFESPLGLLICEKIFVNKLANHYGSIRSFADEILHKREHSLELQMPFIRRLNNSPKIVPILVGSFHKMMAKGKFPEQDEEYDCFVSGLVSSIKEYTANGLSTCIIAGVDMAHMGRYFGDKESLSKDLMKHVELRDMQYINALIHQNKHALFSHIAEDMDARKICGFPTMYTVLDAFDRLGIKYQAELYEYRQAVNYDNDCAVTFAGMGFYM